MCNLQISVMLFLDLTELCILVIKCASNFSLATVLSDKPVSLFSVAVGEGSPNLR